ncbi:MAG: hypothetical protein ACAH95_08340 [Fimbriimonas sp.]
MFGSKYDLVANGSTIWLLSAGNWAKVEKIESGIASITGISANAGTHIPAMLMHTAWGAPFPEKGVGVTIKAEQLAGRNTYHLQAKDQMKRDVWVDAKTYFLIKTTTEVMGRTIVTTYGTPKVNQAIPANRFVK